MDLVKWQLGGCQGLGPGSGVGFRVSGEFRASGPGFKGLDVGLGRGCLKIDRHQTGATTPKNLTTKQTH